MAEIKSQEQYARVVRALKAGEFSDNKAQEEEILEAAEKWLESQWGTTSGMSGTEKFRAGMGKAFSDIGLAARQRASDVASLFPATPSIAGAVAQRQSLQDEAKERRLRDKPLLSSGAGLAGNIVGHMAATAPVGGAVTSFPRAIALGATEGALMPTASSSELASNIGLGGALGAGGQMVSRGLSRTVTPIRRSLSARGDDAVELLRREGVKLDVAQRTGSESAQRVRSGLGDNPLTATRSRNFAEKQKRQFTRAVLRRIGANSDEATPEVLDKAVKEIGDNIDNALRSAPPVWDDVLDAQVREIQRIIPGSMSEDAARPLLKNIDMLMNSAIASGDDVIEPAVFIEVRGNLSRLRADGNTLASDVEDILLDALHRAGGEPEWLKTTLARYRNWKIIENSIDRGTDKTISPKRLAGTFSQKRNRAVSLRHLGHPETVELSKLADAGFELLPETLGNSGTAGRKITGDIMLAVGGAGGAAAGGADVSTAVLTGLGALGLPPLIQRAMLSQGGLANYLVHGGPQILQTAINAPVTQSLLRQGVISGGLLNQ